MMVRCIAVGLATFLLSSSAAAQGVLGDVLAGKLVDAEVGHWAWYDLIDTQSGKRYLLRQAVVGEEKIGRETGHWLEVEIIPDVGYPTFYKMLLTGPASDPENVHRLLLRQGNKPVTEVPVDQGAASLSGDDAERESRGKVELETPKGTLRAEHVVLEEGDSRMELWLNDDVRPMGIVQMRGPQGELVLRDYGEGGKNGSSRIDRTIGDGRSGRSLNTRVEAGLVDGPDDMRRRKDERAGAETAPNRNRQ